MSVSDAPMKRSHGIFCCPKCKTAKHHFVKADDVFMCAECGHEFRALSMGESIQRHRERNRRYYQAHKDAINRKKHEYRMAHLEEEREKERIYRKRNADRINELNRAWRNRNIEQERERCRRYWAEHGEDINLLRNIKKLYSGKWGAR